jgi:Domain of unknown function (DUF4397)
LTDYYGLFAHSFNPLDKHQSSFDRTSIFARETAMKSLHQVLFTLVPIALLAACGGGSDAQDRLDIAKPVLRFVHASPLAPNVTLFRAEVAQPQATNVAYRFASDYFEVDNSAANYAVKTATGNVTIGTATLDTSRGNKYTLVALPSSNTENSVFLITDPFNKSLTSDKAKVRLMNAAFNASNIDLYLNPVGTDISAAAVTPAIAATAYKTSGPASGNDSLDINGGTYQLTLTNAGSKTVLFRGRLVIDNNRDILLLTVPDSILPGAVKTLVKVEGFAGTTEVPGL